MELVVGQGKRDGCCQCQSQFAMPVLVTAVAFSPLDLAIAGSCALILLLLLPAHDQAAVEFVRVLNF